MKYYEFTSIAFDYGIKNIGVAVGQNITKTATPLKPIRSKNGEPNWNDIKKIIDNWQPEIIIVGWPIKMNGKQQYITKKTLYFSQKLYSIFKIIVHLYDERLSTKEAIYNISMYKKKIRSKYDINSLSAVVILESYFKRKHIIN
ncbi:Holliday junction resolvase RuvX [Candidatus Annandia pinicola]|uniref:Holliday junction resolvase RuvX n=1 Tax=Candidatus Annandia pinicola TaxID=1345117 RepID=UPI001D02E72C|nr:Holliday junction resolvase RuvX [Candidatus Annandia pinicola]UDG80546.1 Putative pre-16S rRNA nuclease [Candidatus Annandia pinicola]